MFNLCVVTVSVSGFRFGKTSISAAAQYPHYDNHDHHALPTRDHGHQPYHNQARWPDHHRVSPQRHLHHAGVPPQQQQPAAKAGVQPLPELHYSSDCDHRRGLLPVTAQRADIRWYLPPAGPVL